MSPGKSEKPDGTSTRRACCAGGQRKRHHSPGLVIDHGAVPCLEFTTRGSVALRSGRRGSLRSLPTNWGQC
jgi:hypothetical protein